MTIFKTLPALFGLSFTARGALPYNTNLAATTFTVQTPANTADAALIRFA